MGLLNALRGFSYEGEITKKQKAINLITSKGMFCLVGGLVTAWYLGYSHQLAITAAVGLAVWAIKGWSPGFMMFHERPTDWPYEAEIGFVDDLAAKLSGTQVFLHDKGIGQRFYFDTDEDARKYALIWMSIRGLFILPLFIALGYLGDSLVLGAVLGFLCGVLMGPCYYLGRFIAERVKPGKFIDATRIVEFIYYCVIGSGVYLLNVIGG